MSEDYLTNKEPLPTTETVSLSSIIPNEANDNQEANLTQALAYRQQGYAPIPVGLDKKPLLATWKEFQDRLPTTDEIHAWWTQWPATNIALLCGHGGLVVLDIDVKGHPERKELVERLVAGLRDYAPIIRTPSGGYHAHFTETDATSKSRIITGVGDFQAAGKYVLVPPSQGYEYVNDLREPFAVPTAWDFVTGYLQSCGLELQSEPVNQPKPVEKTIVEGTRDVSLASIGGKLRRIGLDSSEIAAALNAVNTSRCQPPLSNQQVEKIANSVSRYPAGNLTSNALSIPLEMGFVREVNAGELQTKALQDQAPLPYLPVFGLDGYFIKGWSHLLAGYPKTGKTELIVAICQKWCQLDEKILFFTEEPEGVWIERLKKQPVEGWQNVTLIFAIGLKPAEIQTRIKDGSETIVIIDTTRNLLQLENENDNSEISRTLTPQIAVARSSKKTIIFLQHTRKGGGEHGHAIAGGHAFLGVVDIALQLDHDPQSTKSPRRLLRGWGRLYEIPDLIYERSEDGTYKAIGNPNQVAIDEVKERILDVLSSDEWLKTKEVGNELDEPKPSGEQLRQALKKLAEEGKIDRDPPISEGDRRGTTYKWRLRPEGEV